MEIQIIIVFIKEVSYFYYGHNIYFEINIMYELFIGLISFSIFYNLLYRKKHVMYYLFAFLFE